jgi:NAD(P)-dependent dehydrogenase (short-subunit alcohol dehydrogenase family)
MAQRTIVITGASDGIGAAAARELAALGEQVVIVGRSPEKSARVAAELGVPHHVADYASLAQVRRLAAELDATYPRIDVLANNAGGIFGRRELTEDGNELTFQVNHLAGFLLTTLLLPKLVESRAAVIQTASDAARTMSRYDADDLQCERGYSPWRAYGNSKLANIMFTRELHRRHHRDGISAAALHPGVVGSNFGSTSTWATRLFYNLPFLKSRFLLSPGRGADTLVWLAEGTPGTTWQSGDFCERRKSVPVPPQASDDDLARRLWDDSERLLAG